MFVIDYSTPPPLPLPPPAAVATVLLLLLLLLLINSQQLLPLLPNAVIVVGGGCCCCVHPCALNAPKHQKYQVEMTESEQRECPYVRTNKNIVINAGRVGPAEGFMCVPYSGCASVRWVWAVNHHSIVVIRFVCILTVVLSHFRRTVQISSTCVIVGLVC